MYYIFSFAYYVFLVPISLLPFSVLYKISDGLSWVLCYVVRYRKADIFSNLRNSFPKKPETEIQRIAREFYRHLCDTMLESVKTFTVTQKETLPRVYCTNAEVIDKYAKQGRSVLFVAGHYSGFEWLVFSINLLLKHQVSAIYRPLNNAFFEKKIQESRSRMGLKLISMYDVKPYLEHGMVEPTAVVFAMDQSPSKTVNVHWMQFLNQDTAVLFGTEKYAKDYDLPVVFGHLLKHERGRYGITFEVVSDAPQQTTHGEITEKMTRMLEADICQKPEFWLWSHRRWKHKRTA
jgi:Kdo2-lipid IVA lauroyltransferase/acyltransferase